jgi:hypothetical protein
MLFHSYSPFGSNLYRLIALGLEKAVDSGEKN